MSIAILVLLFWVGGFCQQDRQALLPHFNCKKIAFYKTHKTGSSTLGSVLFRIAVTTNMSIYTTRTSHYLSLGYQENQQLLGRADMVLRHIRHSSTPDFHAATRSFYGRALGTADYGFLTILRHPVDRYISHFYYYVEPDARKTNRNLTLHKYAAAGEGANRMAREFAIKDAATALDFVTGEMLADGLFLPLEWLDYGLALLGAHCNWGLTQLIYLPVNANKEGVVRYDNEMLSARPKMAQVAEADPALVDRIAAVNDIDAFLYSATYGQLLARLQLHGPTATSALMAAAVRLMAARKRLEADCHALRGDSSEAAVRKSVNEDYVPPLPSLPPLSPPPPPPPPPRSRHISAGDLAGLCAWYAMPDILYEWMPSPETGHVGPDAVLPSPASWRVGHLLRLADEYMGSYGDPSVQYYHSLLAVHVRLPTAAEAELLYGMTGGSDDRQRLTSLTMAVRLWSVHHSREGVHHLMFLMDSLNMGSQEVDEQENAVRQAAAAALAQNVADANADALSYTTFSIVDCGAAADAKGGGGAAAACGAAAFDAAISTSRWSAVMPDLTHFLYGVRGSVRSVLLSYEGMMQTAGAVCAPLVPWRTPPPEPTASLPSGVGDAACLRTPCSFSTPKDHTLRCVMIRSMPTLGLTKPYTSGGTALPEGRSSYRVPYRGPERVRLEVVRLAPPSEEDFRNAAEAAAAVAVAAAAGESSVEGNPEGQHAVFRCSRMPRPRLRVPWCET